MNFNEILKNFGNVKERVEDSKRRLKNLKITGEGGGGLVRVTLRGDNELLNIEIDDVLFKEAEKGTLEELIISAFSDARKKMRESSLHEMKNIAGDSLPLEGLERLFGL